MSQLANFIVYFLVVCAVTALVNSMIQEEKPGIILRNALHFFLLIVVGILVFSVIVYFLETAEYLIAGGIFAVILAIYFLTRSLPRKS